MSMLAWRRAGLAALTATLLLRAGAAHSDSVELLTNNYDNARSGANLLETVQRHQRQRENIRTPVQLFGGRTGDGAATAGPCSHAGSCARRRVRGNGRQLCLRLDAHDPGGAPLWTRRLAQLPQGDAAPPTGFLSTPVIDRAQGTLYVVAGLMRDHKPSFVLHALNLRDGKDKLPPVAIAGSVKVDDETTAFEPSSTRIAVQRAALALAADNVIIAFDGDYFEGWVFAYDRSDLSRALSVFCTTCASRASAISKVDYLDRRCVALGPGGGIWQAGRAPMVDTASMVYFFTGNKQHVIKDGCTIPFARNACAVCGADGGCECKGNRSANVCRGPHAASAIVCVGQCIEHRTGA